MLSFFQNNYSRHVIKITVNQHLYSLSQFPELMHFLMLVLAMKKSSNTSNSPLRRKALFNSLISKLHLNPEHELLEVNYLPNLETYQSACYTNQYAKHAWRRFARLLLRHLWREGAFCAVCAAQLSPAFAWGENTGGHLSGEDTAELFGKDSPGLHCCSVPE